MSSADLGWQALWTLLPMGALYGVVSVLVFRRFCDAASVRRSVHRMWAHVMELSLFLDSPALVLRAQRDLLRENVRLLRWVIVPSGILAVLFACLFPLQNAIYGRAPLPVGEPSVVTIQMKDAGMSSVQLEAPAGILVETPGVRVVHDRQISWRVRPMQPTSEDLKFRVKNRVLTAGMYTFFWRDPEVRSIDIRYPEASIGSLPWLEWFVISSSVSAVMFGLCSKR
jgi:hypothetical protein